MRRCELCAISRSQRVMLHQRIPFRMNKLWICFECIRTLARNMPIKELYPLTMGQIDNVVFNDEEQQ